ncbi:MAG TPA: DinB family protein [Puia sp.]|nr:DinB family protein [Puia sp.]
MEQVKWFDRKFDFTTTENIFPSIIERLSGTPARLEEKFSAIPPALLTVRVDKGWTIQENLGHLTDLEPLWQKRLDDIVSGRPELSPTDLQNNKTTFAGHNDVPVKNLLQAFRQVRAQTVALLEDIGEETVFKSSLHPRLKTPMRTIDLFLFVAEHDDHHLAAITELVKRSAH